MEEIGTSFFEIYCRFLDKITDDMYMELSLKDTLDILDSLFLDSLSEFSYPNFRINKYDVNAITGDAFDDEGNAVVTGAFYDKLTNEEKDIIAEIMLLNWFRRQISNTRITAMRYSTSDFKQTSQAAHMQRLNAIVDSQRKNINHKLKLYSRRYTDEDGYIKAKVGDLAGTGRSKQIILTQMGKVER